MVQDQHKVKLQAKYNQIQPKRSQNYPNSQNQDRIHIICPIYPIFRPKESNANSTSSDKSVCKLRVLECAGPTIGDILYQKHPWKREQCSRGDCHPCNTKPGCCRSENVLYQMKWQTCFIQQGTNAHYYGESHRALYDRDKEHF